MSFLKKLATFFGGVVITLMIMGTGLITLMYDSPNPADHYHSYCDRYDAPCKEAHCAGNTGCHGYCACADMVNGVCGEYSICSSWVERKESEQ